MKLSSEQVEAGGWVDVEAVIRPHKNHLALNYEWKASSGEIEPGFLLTNTARFYAAASEGEANITVKVTDKYGRSDSKTISFMVIPPRTGAQPTALPR